MRLFRCEIGEKIMFRKNFVSMLVMSAIIAATAVIANAQFGTASGTVQMKDADGNLAPAAGILVELYRTDISGYQKTTTDKKGRFAFATLQLGGEFTMALSGAGAAPAIYPKIKAGMERIAITLDPGDGRKYTEAEVKAGKAAGATTTADQSTGKTQATAELSPEDQKKQAEEQAQIEAIKAKNAKVTKANEIIAAALKAGNEAFQAKNYDLAISKYDEGIAADPNFAGSAPILLNNKAASLMNRAVGTYNANVRNTDATAKLAGFNSAKSDFAESIKAYQRSLEINSNVAPELQIDPKNIESTRTASIRGAKDTFRYAVMTEQVDPSLIPAANVLLPQYEAIEPDAAKKTDAVMILADLYRVSGDMPKAIENYKAVLTSSPNNIDALAGLGLSLVNEGFITGDKAQLQEGANILAQYASAAPDGHKYKADAQGLLDSLKKENNVTPQKGAGSTRKKN